jgi:hypothetical protein
MSEFIKECLLLLLLGFNPRKVTSRHVDCHLSHDPRQKKKKMRPLNGTIS